MVTSRADLTKAAITYMGLKVTRSLESGGNIPTHCPFHVDKTPSLSINVDDGVFRCFSCQRGGSIEKLFKEVVGESVYKTLNIRYDEFSAFSQTQRAPVSEQSFETLDREIQISLSGNVLPYRASRDVISYLRKRGISFEIADAFKFRYAEDAYANHVHFVNRLLIPVYEKGKMISLEGRDVTGLAKPKVLYPKDSSVNTLFELDSLKLDERLYVVEGLMDLALLRMHPAFKNSTSVFGAALTSRQIYLLSKFKEVVYIPDNDDAGKKTVETLRKNPQVSASILKVPAEYRGIPLKDVGDMVNKAHLSLDEIVRRKWLQRITPLT